jgi:integrase
LNKPTAPVCAYHRYPSSQAFVAALCDDAGDEHVVIDPTVWQPSDGTVAKSFYFTVATADPDGAFRSARLTSQSHEQSDNHRRSVIHVLVQRYRNQPRVIHDIGEELVCRTVSRPPSTMPRCSGREAPALFQTPLARPGEASRALALLTLTAPRSGEVFGARWSEFDLDRDRKLWTIPPSA